MKKYIFPILFFFCTGLKAQNSIDTNQVRAFMKMLLDTQLHAAWVQLPDMKGAPLRMLRNGTYAEMNEEYNAHAIQSMVMKLNIVSGFRGTFDSMIFVQPELTPHEHEAALQFAPFPAEEYVLFLKPCYTADQKMQGWRKKFESSIYTPLTAFEVAEANHGVLLVKENPASPIKTNAIRVNVDEMSTLAKIFEWLNEPSHDLKHLQSLARGPFTGTLVQLMIQHYQKH